jgi:hypothetical protein
MPDFVATEKETPRHTFPAHTSWLKPAPSPRRRL